MVDADPNSARNGVRRRRSNPTEHEILSASRQDDAQPSAAHTVTSSTGNPPATTASNAGLATPNRSAHGRSMSSASGIDPNRIVTPEIPLRTVRFSADVDRDQLPSILRSSISPASSIRSPQHAPGLSINVAQPGGGAGDGDRVTPLGVDGRPTTAPLSPGRNRGYSLRSTLFRRNMHPKNGAIELKEATLFSSRPDDNNVDPKDTSGSRGPHISIKPVRSMSHETIDGRKKSRKALSSVSDVLPNYYTAWAQSRKRPGMVKRAIKDFKKAIKQTILRIQEIPPSIDGRHITVDASRKRPLIDDRTGKNYVENWIRSTRYTAYTFLPRQLLAQFSKLANFYFLCIAVLQMIPKLSTTGNYTTIIPLTIFVSISIGKEGFDDYRRYKLDKEENAKEATVLHAYMPTDPSGDSEAGATSTGPIHWATTKWRKLKVGDIIKLKRDESVPADIVLLHAEGENHIAYVETMALDGETNLKSKQTNSAVGRACSTEDGLVSCKADFVVEDPNPNLYRFEGRVTYDNETAPLTNTEIIYRGSVLRNTPEAIGMVIYTGEECKIRMNANKNPRTKAPHLQFVLNRIVPLVVVFVICLALFNSIAYQIWRRGTERKSWYITSAKVPFHEILSAFFIMFSTMIPLSLYVSMEIIKLVQMFLLNDIDMYDEKSNTPFEARTSTINEELGQVTHIFSDKTGTLTDNEMKFRKISVAGTVWLHDIDLQGSQKTILVHKKRNKGKKPRKSFMSDRRKSTASVTEMEVPTYDEIEPTRIGSPKWKSSARPATAQPERSTMELIQYIQRRPASTFSNKAKLFLLSIALCHTCLPEHRSDGTIDFQSSSPDELALVRAAQELGYLVINRKHGLVTLRQNSSADSSESFEEVYEVLDVIDFSSSRKRMSIVVRFPDGRLCVMCKGADSVIMQRLKLSKLAMQKATEIEKRANRRKSMEAQVALARQSTQLDIDRNQSMRRSLSIGGPRRSISGGGASRQARVEVDNWLRAREQDVEIVREQALDHFVNRASGQFPRASIATSGDRSSMLDDEDDIIDESLVADEGAVIERCFQHINEFATEGLRTLLYGYRFVDEQEYDDWKRVYLAATTSLVEREDKIEKAGEMIEYDFDLAGATAIEDKLQAGVPESIDKLRRANIRMWMLTGDKRETAINIGHSCRLIKDYSVVIVLDKEIGEVEQHIAAGLLSLQEEHVAHSVVVVDGMTLAMITSTPYVEHLFFDLATLADSVICCRAQPSQKAQLVKAIRKRIKRSITLAVGDGANDIAMIQEAHVGIGITGKEGLQAARTSDYSVAQFRFLNKLLLVHGRWNYIRTCKYILGTLWKEMVFFLTQAVYQRYNGYTGTSLYESWSLATFNTLFTSLPVLVMGIFEKDLAASTLLAVPELYTKGQRNGGFNLMIYFGWMAMAAVESMIIFFLMQVTFGHALATRDVSLFAMGDMTFVAVVIIISMKMQLVEMHNKSIIAFVSIVISIAAVFLWNILLAIIYPKSGQYHVRHSWFVGFGRNPLWWLTLVLIVLCIAVIEFGVASLRSAWFPTDVDLFQELETDLEVKKRFEEAAALDLQQGWDRGAKRSSGELRREREVAELVRRREHEGGVVVEVRT